MKKYIVLGIILAMSSVSQSVNAQSSVDTTSLGMAGDNLDLVAVLELFQKSKTIEDFEKSLNDTKKGINNLDLDLDKNIDFIKVITKKDGDAYTFILQVPVSKTENQDVAVILVDKDKNKKVTLQIVGDEDLYGKDYIIEPAPATTAVTANPAYTGKDPAATTTASHTTTVVVESAPIVQYVYSPVYVPYVPPYYYGFYPPYFGFVTIMAVGIYRSNHYYGGYYGGYHGGYHGGGGGNTVIINNNNHYNSYKSNRVTSNTVNNNRNSGNYGNGNRGNGNRGSGNNVGNGNNRGSSGSNVSNRNNNTGGLGNGASNNSKGGLNNSSRDARPSTNQSRPSASPAQSRPSPAQSRPSASPSRNMGGGGGRSMGGGGGGGRMGGGRIR
jgi:hypothetical protein